MSNAHPTISLDPPPRVSARHPLRGMETVVLARWLEQSRQLRKLHALGGKARRNVENAARLAYHTAWAQELLLRGDGMSFETAREYARQDLWTPPTLPTTQRRRRRTPAAKRRAPSPSTTPPM